MYSRASGRNFTRLVPLPVSRVSPGQRSGRLSHRELFQVARAEHRRQTDDDCCEQ